MNPIRPIGALLLGASAFGLLALSPAPASAPSATDLDELGRLLRRIEADEDGPWADVVIRTVTKDGPYAVEGAVDIELNGGAWGQGASPDRFTLCRCGASKNKPFCDGSHWDAGFKDG